MQVPYLPKVLDDLDDSFLFSLLVCCVDVAHIGMQDIPLLWKVRERTRNSKWKVRSAFLLWRDQIQGDLGVPLQEAEHQAQGRTEWRRMTHRRAKGHPRPMNLSQVSQVLTKTDI